MMQLVNTYYQLGSQFYSEQHPDPVPAPQLIRTNYRLARELNIDERQLETEQALAVFAGNALPKGSAPIAAVYGGHQFGNWNPGLGDGRAVLLGEVRAADGRLFDIQLKGSGRTPYSRMGDGRSPLGPVLREYLVSEAMAGLRIPTTQALAAVSSGERVVRERLLPGAVLTRVAQSHIRIGTFQYFSARQDMDSVRLLADYVIQRHYETFVSDAYPEDPYTGLLAAVVRAQASLVAQWMSVGFIHGVMNTDNMLLCGETVDYGPCAFMDAYNPAQVYSSIDSQGRYAYGNQPAIARWNLGWLAQALLPLLDGEPSKALEKAEALLEDFVTHYQQSYGTLMAQKLGFEQEGGEVEDLVTKLLALMNDAGADYTSSFRALPQALGPMDNSSALPDSFADWLKAWRGALAAAGISEQRARDRLLRANPKYIARNHLVEAAINQATDDGDYSLFHRLVARLARPFDDDPQDSDLALSPRPDQRVSQTFCGT